MDVRDRLPGLIESLYTAPGSAGGWPRFFAHLCDTLDGACFDAEDVALLDALMPHLKCALQVHQRLVDAEAVARGSMAALERINGGVLLLDTRGRVWLTNRAADHVLSIRDGLSIEDAMLRAASPADMTRLRQTIAGAVETSRGAGTNAGSALLLERPSGRRPLRVVVTPMRRKPLAFLSDAEAVGAMVFITDPEQTPIPSEDEIRTLLHLTAAEARLARALVEGLDIQDAATRFGLAAGTLRTRLKSVFEKTGTHRQVDLIRLILTSPLGLVFAYLATA